MSGGYSKQDGVIKYAQNDNERYDLRLNYDYDFSKRVRLETKFLLKIRNVRMLVESFFQLITEAIFGMPNHPVYTQDNKNFAQGGWGQCGSTS